MDTITIRATIKRKKLPHRTTINIIEVFPRELDEVESELTVSGIIAGVVGVDITVVVGVSRVLDVEVLEVRIIVDIVARLLSREKNEFGRVEN